MHDDDERSLSTADLAGQGRTGGAASDESLSRELTDGRYDAEVESTPLFEAEDGTRFREEWDRIQVGFVDEPRRAVESADALVAELMQRLAAGFAEERSRLEGQWDRGDDVSTEDLRVALQRYRSFFTRLLNA